MKKWFAVVLCMVLLLLSLSSCSAGDVDYHRGMWYLQQGNHQEAYTYLRASASPLAARELEKFLFVPLTFTTIDDGHRMERVYTYDENGLPKTVTTNHDDTLGGATICVEEYGYVGLQMRSYRMTDHHSYGTEETVQTYDERGNLTYDYYRSAYGEVSETYSAYDHWGNQLSEYGDAWDGEVIYRMESTYDDQGRLLTYSRNRNDTFTAEGYRVYNEDGSFVEHERYTEPGAEGRTQTNYDTEGRVVRVSTTPAGTNTAEYPNGRYVSVYRYDAAGNPVYAYEQSEIGLMITTREYNERDQLMHLHTMDERGSVWNEEKYTYDAAGRLLCEARSYDGYSWEKTDYTYDAAGRLTETLGDFGTRRYVYNEDGTLREVTQEYSYETATFTYGYDAWGNREQGLKHTDQLDSHYAATWELRYYPDGIPQEIPAFIEDMNWGSDR